MELIVGVSSGLIDMVLSLYLPLFMIIGYWYSFKHTSVVFMAFIGSLVLKKQFFNWIVYKS